MKMLHCVRSTSRGHCRSPRDTGDASRRSGPHSRPSVSGVNVASTATLTTVASQGNCNSRIRTSPRGAAPPQYRLIPGKDAPLEITAVFLIGYTALYAVASDNLRVAL